ncbi:MAG: fumarylacetoacetase [Candidatus Eremiobacteraeota bacterium]|nr:fumarylacetoacetase [Candidatus Eremiobacteraeota bacterium]
MPIWIDVPASSPFTVDTLPYGIFSTGTEAPRGGVAIGDTVIDLAVLARAGLFDRTVNDPARLFAAPVLDRLAGAGRDVWAAVRARIVTLLDAANHELQGHPVLLSTAVLRRDTVTMHRPVGAGDYVDFFSSIEHATNFGKILRPGAPLMPNYRSMPIGYHGRSSTIVVGGTPIVRPHGQRRPDPDAPAVYEPTRALDFELELAFIAGPGNALGEPIPIDAAGDHIFGCALMNDWSARDVQSWEYQPLGPFLGKSFATSIAPWVVPLEALEPFRIASREQEPPPLPYLATTHPWGFDIDFTVPLESDLMRARGLAPCPISRTSFARMYWSMAQQLAHVTANGTQIRPGDVYGSGTISGAEPGSFGSIFELTWGGTAPIDLPSGERRTFVEDGDTIAMTGSCARGELRVGFGEVSGTILPAVKTIS